MVRHSLDGKRIWVAGHRGMVGSAVMRQLQTLDGVTLLRAAKSELDLRDQANVRAFYAEQKPDMVVLAAAKVGGIKANNAFPTEFLLDNLAIELNVIQGAVEASVEKLLFLGSSCIYPKLARQPIKESELLTGSLEPTNEAYALAKISGLKACEYINRQKGRDFIAAMPCNLYGVGDNYHSEHSHVIPGLIRRFHEGKIHGLDKVVIWGSGRQLREFLYVDDLAEALVMLLANYTAAEFINVGSGKEISILELAQLIAHVVGYDGEIVTDPSKPDGTPRKVLDVTKINALGWQANTTLQAGLQRAYADFCRRAGSIQ